ncbi:MAG: hypothetical protein HQP61_03830 [Peptococcaceae bacterium]|nr:hypothetical protein [Candidatus Syntrophopropionicum ammoniitolerans]
MRRRGKVYRNSAERREPREKHLIAARHPVPKLEEKKPQQEKQVPQKKQEVKPSGLPLTVVLEILAAEYEDGPLGNALCKVAVHLAEESGEIASFRARWDVAQENPSGSQSTYLFDRRQAMELMRYHRNKGNKEAQKKEEEKLLMVEGRLLLGQSTPLRITNNDLEKLEEFIKDHGF